MQTIWKKPVTLALEGPDQWVVIQTTQAATWALVEDWPTEEGPALIGLVRFARMSCRANETGKRRGRRSSTLRSKPESRSRNEAGGSGT